jgi:rSAM/selenodomain-associated transferase 1
VADAPSRDTRLQLFGRFPEAGAVKTRLARRIGAGEACRVHEELLRSTAATLREAGLGPVELWLDSCAPHPLVDELLASGLEGPFLQAGADLGERMHHALCRGLRVADAVILVGSDCPAMDADYLASARDALRASDVVFGPAEDGGYVLVAANRVTAELFAGIPWGTDAVLATSLGAAERSGLTVALLESRYDVDEWEDLVRWRREFP